MNLTFDSKHIKVYDNVLTDNQFDKLFTWYNNIPLVYKVADGEWNRLWSFDSQVLYGKSYYFPKGKTPPLREDTEIIPLIEAVNSVISNGKVTMTPYCYAPGSGLSWHNDSNYSEAFTFYCHNYWSPEWGGELQTIEVKENVDCQIFDNQKLYDSIMNNGVGNFFHPKPNRLIVNSNILHKVNKTTTNSNARLTLQGFIN